LNYITQLTLTGIALTQLIEATKRWETNTSLVALVDDLDTQVGALFLKQGNALVRALNPLRKLIKEDAIGNQFDAIFGVAAEATSIDMLDAMTKSYSSSLLLGGKQQLSEIGVKISFSLDNPRAAQYIQLYGADQITGIDDTTRTDIRNLIRAGIENGESYSTIAASIKARYKYYATGVPQQHIRSRAQLIAVTECGNGYQAGNFSSMQAVQDTVIKMLKHWLTIGDDRVSEGCKTNQADGWIPLNKEHTSGHMHPLRFPGDRCVEQYKRDRIVKPVVISKPKAKTEPKAKPAAFVPYEFNTANAANVHDALGDLYPGTSSFWDKKITLADMRSMGLYDPSTGKLTLSTKYTKKEMQDERFKALVHELMHSRSKGTRDFNLEGLGWEEAIVEGNAQLSALDIAKKAKYTFVDEKAFLADFKEHPYYSKWIKPLDDAVDELGIDRAAFYKGMLGKTCDDRKQYLRNAYKKKYPKGDDARTKFLALNKALQ
jgi:hypothetical protein